MKHWFLWLIVGIASIIGGILALLNPLAASIAAAKLAGWFFLFAGLLQIFTAWRAKGLGTTLWTALVGLASALVGIAILDRPLAGIVSLTLVVAVLFLVTGIAKLLTGFALRGSRFFLPVLISGIISILLAVMILDNFPASAFSILGILLAVELISNGVSLIALSLNHKARVPALA